VAGFNAFSHLRPREFRRSLQADQLWRLGFNREVAEIEHALVQDIAEAYAANKAVLLDKAGTVRRAVRAVGYEVFFVGLALVVAQLS